MEALFEILYSGLALKPTGIIVGAALVAVHVAAVIKADALRQWLPKLPRHKKLGIAILAVDLAWSWIVLYHMDMGEFYTLRKPLLFGLPVAAFLVVTFADEFLAVRAIGTLLLLLACPVLGAAFLEEPTSRLLLPTLAYAWILAGLFWVGMPYLLRDLITWLVGSPIRFRNACVAGIAYGSAVLVCAVAFY